MRLSNDVAKFVSNEIILYSCKLIIRMYFSLFLNFLRYTAVLRRPRGLCQACDGRVLGRDAEIQPTTVAFALRKPESPARTNGRGLRIVPKPGCATQLLPSLPPAGACHGVKQPLRSGSHHDSSSSIGCLRSASPERWRVGVSPPGAERFDHQHGRPDGGT